MVVLPLRRAAFIAIFLLHGTSTLWGMQEISTDYSGRCSATWLLNTAVTLWLALSALGHRHSVPLHVTLCDNHSCMGASTSAMYLPSLPSGPPAIGRVGVQLRTGTGTPRQEHSAVGGG